MYTKLILDFALCDLEIWVKVTVHKAKVDCFYDANHVVVDQRNAKA